MELRLPLEMSPGREAACRAVFGTWGFFPNDAWKNCPFALTSFTGWSSERCPGIGFLSRGDREIGVLRNVEAHRRPRLECRRETGLILRCDRKVGNTFQTKQGSRPSCPDQEGRKGSEHSSEAEARPPHKGGRTSDLFKGVILSFPPHSQDIAAVAVSLQDTGCQSSPAPGMCGQSLSEPASKTPIIPQKPTPANI